MDEALWALGRGAGTVTLVLMTVSVLLGILTRSGRPAFGLPRFAVTRVHRDAGLLAAVLLALHLVTLWLDPYAQLRVVDTVVPFLGGFRPFWQGLGTVALDLLAAILLTSLLRARVGLRTWRTVHWASYVLWPVAVAHGLGNGSDAFSTWFLVVTGVCVLSVAVALAWRVQATFVEHRGARIEPTVPRVPARFR